MKGEYRGVEGSSPRRLIKRTHNKNPTLYEMFHIANLSICLDYFNLKYSLRVNLIPSK